MNASPATPAQALGERITVTLIPKAEDDLRRLQERTNLSKTDLANRAIILYEFFDAELRAGQDLITRNSRTGKTQLVRFADAPAEQAPPARLAWYRRGVAGRAGQPRQHRRWFLSPARSAREVGAVRRLAAVNLAVPEPRTR